MINILKISIDLKNVVQGQRPNDLLDVWFDLSGHQSYTCPFEKKEINRQTEYREIWDEVDTHFSQWFDGVIDIGNKGNTKYVCRRSIYKLNIEKCGMEWT